MLQCRSTEEVPLHDGGDGDVEDEQEAQEAEVGSNPGPEATFDRLDPGSPKGQRGATIPLLFPVEEKFS
jgi:hypothetical protein